MRSSQEAQDREIFGARRDARDLALAMQAALRQPAILSLCDADRRFAFVNGALQFDDVGWVHTQDDSGLDGVSLHRLQQAEHAEHVAQEPQRAREIVDGILERLDHAEPATWRVLATSAWQAHRAGDAGRCKARRRQLAKRLRDVTPVMFGDMDVVDALLSETLLNATVGDPITPERLQMMTFLPKDVGLAALRRLRELGIDTDALQGPLRSISARRELLRAAATFSLDAGPAATTAYRGQVALWFPAEKGNALGALVDPSWLSTLPGLGTTRPTNLELPPIPDRGTVVFAHETGAEPILPEVAWVTPPPLPDPPWFASPAALLTASIALLLLFAGSGWTTLRSLSRETVAMRARSDFLSGVTHELKTPVASLRLMADVLHDDDVPEQRQQEYFAMMAGECSRLSALIDNVLDLGQMERGERAYDLRTDDIADAVREAVQAFMPLGNHQGLAVELVEETQSASCVFDRGAITQTLLNLLENARKYASSGKRIEVSTHNGDGRFAVRVRDHGPGVPEAERERIFERFHRAEAQQSGSVAGVGLGLFLSRSIMRYHGGTLTCRQPTSGQGCVFELTLPLHREENVS